jgi:hypothetical protein
MFSRGSMQAALIGVAAVLVIAGCSTTSKPDTYSRVAPDVDFRGVKTYGFLSEMATDRQGYESLETNFLKVAVAQQLDLRGLHYDPENPEVLMNFYIHTEDKIRSRQTPSMGGGYYGYRGGYYDSFGYGGYETTIEQYTVGTLTIDMIDAKARKILWEGTATGRVSKKDVQNLEETIDLAVQDIFMKFPVLDVSQ